MANEEHLAILKSGVDKWNQWRIEQMIASPDLSNIDLQNVDLSEANLFQANLIQAKLNGAKLKNADLSRAILVRADLSRADLSGVDLSFATLMEVTMKEANLAHANLIEADLRAAYLPGAILTKADLSNARLHSADLNHAILIGANLFKADLSQVNMYEANLREANLFETDISMSDLSLADFSNANLSFSCLVGADLYCTVLHGADLNYSDLTCANLTEADFTDATLENAIIYGISVWNINKKGLKQNNLVITRNNEPKITVDDLEIAQFIYLILNNQKLRDVIGTIAKKGVLILGRFTEDRKKILDAIRDKLREHDFLPIMFDFEKANERDFTETIKLLAGMSRFVITDITNPKSSPLELQALIPDYKIPFVTIIQKNEEPFSMFRDLEQYPWVLPPIKYGSEAGLSKGFKKGIIEEALKAEQSILAKKNAPLLPTRDIEDYGD